MQIKPSMQYDHALGALRGLSLGDALGMPTQSMSAESIRRAYGTVTGLVDAVDDEPIAPGMPAGSVTDDTEQALLVAAQICGNGGHIDPHALASALLSWEDDMKARGSLDLLGPSTKLALEQVRNGADIATTGRTGTTNGAAMRVTPVGIAHSTQTPDFADYVYESCRVTHNTVPGYQSAYLVAAAVSCAIDGASTRDCITQAIDLAGAMRWKGAWSPKASVLARVRLGVDVCVATDDDARFIRRLRDEFGTSVESNESVAVAFALAYRYFDRPLKALLTAVNIGGDTDTMAAMSGAILGASVGADAFPRALTGKVAEVSRLELEPVAESLLAVRTR
ncbi:MAG: ADP-ribosylglycohydrolase family protein [Bifidobacterium sp.]|jgi:ADP-ribosylglycohydrolase|nr:ADP-ribosylglycohydrolase family protein [Bifidobacterium sp.]MCI1865619.1 ADP-ribosylglycohydrolase family protein [Bifidobacterium sp.]